MQEIKKAVEQALKESVEARNDDTVLLWLVCKQFSKDTPDLKFFQTIPNVESIIHAKRDLQSKEKKYFKKKL